MCWEHLCREQVMMAFSPVITGCKSGKECEPPWLLWGAWGALTITSLTTPPGACVQHSSLLSHTDISSTKESWRAKIPHLAMVVCWSGTPELIIPVMTSSASAHWVEWPENQEEQCSPGSQSVLALLIAVLHNGLLCYQCEGLPWELCHLLSSQLGLSKSSLTTK